MSKLNRLIPWVTQPQGAANVDWGNPLTRGLRDLSSLGGSQRRNVARNNFLSSNGTVNSDPRGPIITTDATAYSVPGGYAALPITVVIGFVRLGAPTAGNHALWISKDDITGNGGLYFRYEDAGTLAVLKSQTAAVGSGVFTVKPGGSLLAVTVDSGNFALYGDGALVASGAHAQTFTSVTPVIGSESSNAAEDHPNGIFYFHAVWGRVLSANEIKRISDNPWQLYAPRKRQIYASVSNATARTSTTSLTAAIRQARTATASASAAILQARSANASLSSAVRVNRTTTAGIDSALLRAVTVQAGLNAALKQLRTVTTGTDAAIKRALSASASLDSAIKAARTATAGMDGYVLGGNMAVASLSAAIKASRTALASVDAAIRSARTASTGLSAGVLDRKTAVATLNAYIFAGQMAVASINAAILERKTLTTALNAYVLAGALLTVPRQMYSNSQTSSRSNKQTARRP